MNKFKKLLAVLVCAAMALAVMPGVALAAGVPSGLEYDLYDDQVEITGYTGDAAELEIPAEIEGLPVTTIGNYAFEGCTGLTSVTIPSSVTSIGYSAFENCESLTSVTIPGNVGTINNGAFEGCTGLSEITINDGVRRINNWAFADCTSLTSVIIPDSVTSIGFDAFSDCVRLAEVVIGDGVIILGGFKGCTGLTNVTIPNSVTEIDDEAFSGCSGLTSISIPNSVTYIGDQAFEYCTGFTSVDIPDRVTHIGWGAFFGCTNLINVTIPDSVMEIGWGAFSITALSNDNTNWDNDVLYINNHLIDTDVKIYGEYIIKPSTRSIADSAFSGHAGLAAVTIPKSIVAIGENAFSGCIDLADVYYAGSEEDWMNIHISSGNSPLFNAAKHFNSMISDTFVGILYGKYNDHITICGSIGNSSELIIPDIIESLPVTEIKWSAFEGRTDLTSVNIPNSVTEIGSHAFSGCTGLTNVNIPENLKTIEFCVFSGCTGLTSVNIPENVKTIESDAFSDCTGLKSVTIPDNISEIQSSAFDNTALYNDNANWNKNVLYINNHLIKAREEISSDCAISPGTLTIASGAFKNCHNLISVTIPSSVTYIGRDSFYGCHSLTSITIPDSVKEIVGSPFASCDSLKEIKVDINNEYYISPDGVLFDKGMTTLIQYPAGNARTSYDIPEGVMEIGNQSFTDCYNLTNVTIPSSVTEIDTSPFESCTGLKKIEVDADNEYLTSINGVLFDKEMTTLIQYPAGNTRKNYTIPDGIMVIGDSAFSECYNLKSVTIPDSVTEIQWDAFSCCTNLTSMIIPNSVTWIDDYTFESCISLTSVAISRSVTEIGCGAFCDCDSLTDIYYSGNKNEWADIYIDEEDNDPLLNANIHYNSIGLVIPAEPEIAEPEITVDGENLVIDTQVDNIEPDETVTLVVIADRDDGCTISWIEGGSGSVTVPAEGVKTVKIFAWESLESMRPLCQAKEVAVQ